MRRIKRAFALLLALALLMGVVLTRLALADDEGQPAQEVPSGSSEGNSGSDSSGKSGSDSGGGSSGNSGNESGGSSGGSSGSSGSENGGSGGGNGGSSGSENGGNSGGNGGSSGNENGGNSGNENGGSSGNENGNNSGNENGSNSGNENGGESGNENGNDSGNENGGESGNENGGESGNENGGNSGNENGGESGNENGGESGNENGDESGNENGDDSGNENGDDPPVSDPSVTPTPTPSADPSVTPEPSSTPEAGELTIAVTSPEGLTPSNGVYTVALSKQLTSLTLAWSCTVDCDSYAVVVTGPDGSELANARQSQESLVVSVQGVSAGRVTVCVTGFQEGATVAQAKIGIELTQSDPHPEKPHGGFPPGGFPSGGFPRGSFRGKTGATGDAAGFEVDQGFHVTAGEALTSAHIAGDRDMSLYGSLALSWDEAEAMTTLTLDGTTLDIHLADGGEFTAELDGATLALTPAGDAQAWTLNGYALKTLARSGVETLLLTLNGEAIPFPTQPVLTGDAYGALCAAGYVSADYDYTVAPDGVEVRVDGATWRLSKDGELSSTEG